MKIRAILRLRNDFLLSARERLNFSQKELADAAGINLNDMLNFESMKFGEITDISSKVQKLATALECSTFDIVPEGLENHSLKTTLNVTREIPTANILELKETKLLTCEAVEDAYDTVTKIAALEKAMKEILTDRERTILRMRFGIGGFPTMTYEEIGNKLKLTRSCIGQHVYKALEKMRGSSVYEQSGLPRPVSTAQRRFRLACDEEQPSDRLLSEFDCLRKRKRKRRIVVSKQGAPIKIIFRKKQEQNEKEAPQG